MVVALSTLEGSRVKNRDASFLVRNDSDAIRETSLDARKGSKGASGFVTTEADAFRPKEAERKGKRKETDLRSELSGGVRAHFECEREGDEKAPRLV